MNRFVKWGLYTFGGLLTLILVLVVAARLYVGGVNFPLGGDDYDASKVSAGITVPEGFSIGVYAEGVQNARVLRFSRSGDLLVANPNLDKVMLLERDENDDYKADGKRVLIDGLNGPNGLDFFKDWLYIAETDAIGRVRFDHTTGNVVGEYERLVTGLPEGGNHWKKTLRFGPDDMMYVAMGSSCNVCIELDERRASMVRYSPDGKNETIFARGLRNSAGFDWSPNDGQIYATDNGRDMLGDDFPPCELNQVIEGAHYGWPFANGDKLADPDFGDGQQEIIESSIAPVFGYKAHNAPLGIEFIREDKFPPEYHGAAIVALHGSWNRSEKDGYKMVSMHWDSSQRVIEKDFVTGFLVDDEVFGRPAEVAEGPDGAIYFSDDYFGVIYRVAYGETQVLDAGIETIKYDADETLSLLTDEARRNMLSKGQEMFEHFQCVSCHDDSGKGLKVLENLGNKYNLETMAEYIRRPNTPMPVFPLNDEERRAVAVYLIDRYPGEVSN